MTRRKRTEKRQTLETFGRRPHRVRLFIEKGGDRVKVTWYEAGLLRTESRENTPEHRLAMREFAKGVLDGLLAPQRPVAKLTVTALWTKYAEAEFPALRRRTQILNAEAWRKWTLAVGGSTVAEDLGPDSMAKLRAELDDQGLAVRSVSRIIRGVKLVYNWADAHELIGRNRIARYRFKVAKDKRPPRVAEYRSDDFAKLMAMMPMDNGRRWRAGAVIRICGYQGVRQNAVLHLEPDCLDFDGGRIHWKAEWDKLGRDWWQPMRAPTREVLVQSLVWREKRGYEGRWLFPATRSKLGRPYSAQSLWWALREAEKRAGIPHLPNRGAHGLRRMLAGDVLAATNNLKTAGDAIGDRDLQVLADSYLVEREDAVRDAFDELDRAWNTPETVSPTVITRKAGAE